MLTSLMRQLWRSQIRLVAFLLLLSLSGSLLCIGANVFHSVNEQVNALDAQYTTIALPDNRMPEQDMPSDMPSPTEDFDAWLAATEEFDIAKIDRMRTVHRAAEAAASSRFVLRTEKRDMFAAYIPGAQPLISGTLAWHEYDVMFDKPLNLAMLVVTCTNVEPLESITTHYEQEHEGAEAVPREYATISYTVSAVVEDSVFLHPDYPAPGEIFPSFTSRDGSGTVAYPKEIVISGNITDAAGSIPFEAGKTYIVRGEYAGVGMYTNEREEWSLLDTLPELSLNTVNLYGGSAEDLIVREERDGKLYRYWVMPEEFPVAAELPAGMDAEAFLQSEVGRVWRENLIPVLDTTLHSVSVITVEKLQSLLLFNNYTTGIAQGRSFSEAECAMGEKLCIVNEVFADKNGYTIGDTLPLAFYNPGATEYQISGGLGTKNASSETLLAMFSYWPDIPIADAETFTIVGTYRHVDFAYGDYSFSPNTIFIPSRSATAQKAPYGKSTEGLAISSTIILKNGSMEAFEAEMESLGFGGCFLYFDQGYTEADIGILAMADNAKRLMLFSGILFAVAVLLFAFLNALWARRSAMIMRQLGTMPKIIFGNAIVCVLGIALVATLLGGIFGAALFDSVCSVAFAGSELPFAFSWSRALLSLVALFAFTVLASICFIAGMLFSNPMRRVVK